MKYVVYVAQARHEPFFSFAQAADCFLAHLRAGEEADIPCTVSDGYYLLIEPDIPHRNDQVLSGTEVRALAERIGLTDEHGNPRLNDVIEQSVAHHVFKTPAARQPIHDLAETLGILGKIS